MKTNRLSVILLALAVMSVSAPVLAHHHPWRPGPRPMHHYHHHSYWGRGGCHFWPGFVGGVIGGVAAAAVVQSQPVVVQSAPVVVQPAPVVVQQPAPVIVQQAAPVVVQQAAPQVVSPVQNVWVEGHYVEQPQGNGTVIRIWQPGHYEQRPVVAK